MPTESEPVRIIEGDALEVLRALPDGCVDAIVTDPPYFGVKEDEWDNQWETAGEFVAWLGAVLDEFRRLMRPNGSLYLFASAEMVARVELAIAERFNILNRICWAKPRYSTKAEMNEKESQRSYFPRAEYLVFAEQLGGDETSGWNEARRRTSRSAFGEPIRRAMEAAGVSGRDICEAMKLYGKVNHGGVVSNWLSGHNEPTADQWEELVAYFARFGVEGLLISSKPDPLRRYEELRRHFSVTAADPYSDVWEFPTVNVYPGKHPCEKPLAMMRHILRASSRPGDLILDAFAGSGTTGHAAAVENRRAILVERESKYAEFARRRVAEAMGRGKGSLLAWAEGQ